MKLEVGNRVTLISGNPNQVHTIKEIYANGRALLDNGMIWDISDLESADWRYLRLAI